VRQGALEACEITGKHVLPSELERCMATGKRALKRLLVTSSVSQGPVLKTWRSIQRVGISARRAKRAPMHLEWCPPANHKAGRRKSAQNWRQAHLALDPRVSVNRSAVRRKLRQHRLDATRA
jgi:hypothetical protein